MDKRAREAVAMAATVRLPDGGILYGPGAAVWGNPARRDYAWRCGCCPWTGNWYKSLASAERAARRHAHKDHPRGACLVQAGS